MSDILALPLNIPLQDQFGNVLPGSRVEIESVTMTNGQSQLQFAELYLDNTGNNSYTGDIFTNEDGYPRSTHGGTVYLKQGVYNVRYVIDGGVAEIKELHFVNAALMSGLLDSVTAILGDTQSFTDQLTIVSNNLSQAIAAQQTADSQLQANIDANTALITQAQQDATAALQAGASSNTLAQANQTALNNQIQKQSMDHGTQQVKIDSLENTQSDQDTKISDLEASQGQQNTDIAALNASQTEQDTKISGLEAEQLVQNAAIQNVVNSNDLDALRSDLESQIQQGDSDLMELIPTIVRKNIYVSDTGNDQTGEGSVSNPFLTISKALEDPSFFSTINLSSASAHVFDFPSYEVGIKDIEIKSTGNDVIDWSGLLKILGSTIKFNNVVVRINTPVAAERLIFGYGNILFESVSFESDQASINIIDRSFTVNNSIAYLALSSASFSNLDQTPYSGNLKIFRGGSTSPTIYQIRNSIMPASYVEGGTLMPDSNSTYMESL